MELYLNLLITSVFRPHLLHETMTLKIALRKKVIHTNSEYVRNKNTQKINHDVVMWWNRVTVQHVLKWFFFLFLSQQFATDYNLLKNDSATFV